MKKTIEYKLRTTVKDRRALLKLLDKGKNVYNLGLSECKKRLNKIRADEEYVALLTKRKGLRKQGSPLAIVNAQLAKIVRDRYGLTKNDIEKYTKDHIGYLADGFNSQFAQVLADRAFETIEKVLYGTRSRCGSTARKVRFKGKWDNILCSINSKSTATGVFMDPEDMTITYGSLSIPLVTDYRNDDGYHKFYLEQITENIREHKAVDISYIRIMRRVSKGQDVFYAQFVIDTRSFGMSDTQVEAENSRIEAYNAALIHKALEAGKPTSRLRLKHDVPHIVEYPKTNKAIELIRSLGLSHKFISGFDMGPKMMAVFLRSEDMSIAILQPVFDKLVEYAEEMRLLHRKLDRQRRANNPDNFNLDGTIRKGRTNSRGSRQKLRWKRSKGYIETQARIRELHRLVRETRKTVLNELSSIIAALSNSLKTEANGYKGWQKTYGKSIGNFAPSYFISDVMSKAERAGNETTKIPLQTALSQYCACGERRKKKLSERLHTCGCGVISQRDVMSAYLGTFVPGVDGVGMGRLTLPIDYEADRQLLEASHRLYTEMTSRRGLSFALCCDKRQQSHSCPNGDRQLSENGEGARLRSFDSLKSLIGSLARAEVEKLLPHS
jgi:hypothetical protein